MTSEPNVTVERPKHMIRRPIAVILCTLGILAVPAAWIGWEMIQEVPCGCIGPGVDRPNQAP